MNESIIDRLNREEIKLASVKKRIYAFIVDDFIISMLFWAIYYNSLISVGEDYDALINLISVLMPQFILLKIFYQTFFTWKYGATLGKIFFHIICIDSTMLSTPTLGASFIRAIVRIVSGWCFYLGFIWALGNPIRQTWHDKFAKTVVCDVR